MEGARHREKKKAKLSALEKLTPKELWPIFSYLDVCSLSKCTRVSSVWRNTAKNLFISFENNANALNEFVNIMRELLIISDCLLFPAGRLPSTFGFSFSSSDVSLSSASNDTRYNTKKHRRHGESKFIHECRTFLHNIDPRLTRSPYNLGQAVNLNNMGLVSLVMIDKAALAEELFMKLYPTIRLILNKAACHTFGHRQQNILWSYLVEREKRILTYHNPFQKVASIISKHTQNNNIFYGYQATDSTGTQLEQLKKKLTELTSDLTSFSKSVLEPHISRSSRHFGAEIFSHIAQSIMMTLTKPLIQLPLVSEIYSSSLLHAMRNSDKLEHICFLGSCTSSPNQFHFGSNLYPQCSYNYSTFAENLKYCKSLKSLSFHDPLAFSSLSSILTSLSEQDGVREMSLSTGILNANDINQLSHLLRSCNNASGSIFQEVTAQPKTKFPASLKKLVVETYLASPIKVIHRSVKKLLYLLSEAAVKEPNSVNLEELVLLAPFISCDTALSPFLERTKTLRSFEIFGCVRNNALYSTGWTAFCHSLAKNTSIKHVTLTCDPYVRGQVMSAEDLFSEHAILREMNTGLNISYFSETNVGNNAQSPYNAIIETESYFDLFLNCCLEMKQLERLTLILPCSQEVKSINMGSALYKFLSNPKLHLKEIDIMVGAQPQATMETKIFSDLLFSLIAEGIKNDSKLNSLLTLSFQSRFSFALPSLATFAKPLPSGRQIDTLRLRAGSNSCSFNEFLHRLTDSSSINVKNLELFSLFTPTLAPPPMLGAFNANSARVSNNLVGLTVFDEICSFLEANRHNGLSALHLHCLNGIFEGTKLISLAKSLANNTLLERISISAVVSALSSVFSSAGPFLKDNKTLKSFSLVTDSELRNKFIQNEVPRRTFGKIPELFNFQTHYPLPDIVKGLEMIALQQEKAGSKPKPAVAGSATLAGSNTTLNSSLGSDYNDDDDDARYVVDDDHGLHNLGDPFGGGGIATQLPALGTLTNKDAIWYELGFNSSVCHQVDQWISGLLKNEVLDNKLNASPFGNPFNQNTNYAIEQSSTLDANTKQAILAWKAGKFEDDFVRRYQTVL